MKDITGTKYNKLTVTSFAHKKFEQGKNAIHRFYYWNCICDCGNLAIVNRNALISGQTTSCGCNRGLKDKQASFNAFYRGYLNGAKKRNYEFELSKEQFKQITSENCHYCNAAPTKERKGTPHLKGFYVGNGVDRKQNDIGYTIENSVACCEQCNFAKGSMQYQEFLDWIVKIYTNLMSSI